MTREDVPLKPRSVKLQEAVAVAKGAASAVIVTMPVPAFAFVGAWPIGPSASMFFLFMLADRIRLTWLVLRGDERVTWCPKCEDVILRKKRSYHGCYRRAQMEELGLIHER